MLIKVFSVFDVKVAAYAQPFFMRTSGEAVRAFVQSCNDENTQLAKTPEDFSLFELGEFNDQNGLMTSYDHPKVIMKASDARLSVRDRFEQECG